MQGLWGPPLLLLGRAECAQCLGRGGAERWVAAHHEASAKPFSLLEGAKARLHFLACCAGGSSHMAMLWLGARGGSEVNS